MRSGPFVMCLVAAAGATAGAALMMEAPRPATAEPIPASALTVIDPVATEDVATLTRLASEMAARGDIAQAADTLSRALKVGPATPELHIDRGLLRLRLGEVEAAREDFNGALALDEHAAGAVAGMGLTWLSEADQAKAAQCFDLAISRDPTVSYAWRGRAEVLAAGDDHAGAVTALDEALRLDPGDVRALIMRARSRALTRDGHGALEDAERAIKLAPYDMDAWYTLGSLHLLRRDFPETIRAADRALQIDRTAVDMLALRAWARSARGQTRSSTEDAAAALELAPEGWRHRAAMEKIAGASARESVLTVGAPPVVPPEVASEALPPSPQDTGPDEATAVAIPPTAAPE